MAEENLQQWKDGDREVGHQARRKEKERKEGHLNN